MHPEPQTRHLLFKMQHIQTNPRWTSIQHVTYKIAGMHQTILQNGQLMTPVTVVRSPNLLPHLDRGWQLLLGQDHKHIDNHWIAGR